MSFSDEFDDARSAGPLEQGSRSILWLKVGFHGPGWNRVINNVLSAREKVARFQLFRAFAPRALRCTTIAFCLNPQLHYNKGRLPCTFQGRLWTG